MIDHLEENALIFNRALGTNSLWNCMKIILANFFVNIGA